MCLEQDHEDDGEDIKIPEHATEGFKRRVA